VLPMANAEPGPRQARRTRADRALARSGSGSDGVVDGRDDRGHVADGVSGSVSSLLLSALIRQPGGRQGRQQLADPGLGPVGGGAAKDVAEILEERSTDEVAAANKKFRWK